MRPGHNPDPPAIDRPDPPANPPDPRGSLADLGNALDKVKRLTAALELKDAQIESLKRRGKSVAPYVERIEALEAALNKLLAAKGDHMTACDRTMGATHPCTCGANEARQLFAGDTGHVHDWSDVDAFGWRRCRNTDCNAGMPPSIPKTVEDSGQ